MRKWEREGYIVEERGHDYDLNKLTVVYQDGKELQEMKKKMKVLGFDGTVTEVTEGYIGCWTDDKDFIWDLYFGSDKEFMGVCIDNFSEAQIKALELDCFLGEGFYSPDFEGTVLDDYSIQYEL